MSPSRRPDARASLPRTLDPRPQFLTRRSLVVLVAAGLLACGSDPATRGAGVEIGRAGDGALDAVLEVVRERWNLPALAAVLVHDGRVVEKGAVGLRAVGTDVRVTVNDRWHLGSLTKAMTATLAAVLVERGTVSWGTTVAAAFPGFVGTIHPEYEDVRLDELLYHTAGLPDDIATPSLGTILDDAVPLGEQRRRWSEELLQQTPQTPRGTHRYTNAGYIVAGAMLEAVAEARWEELLGRDVLDALGMSSSGFGPPGTSGVVDQPLGHVATGITWRAYDPADPAADNHPALGPAGTVHSTLDDYARYMLAHLNGARGSGGLVTVATFDKLHAPSPGTEYALGWGVVQRSWAGGPALTHSGSNLRWFARVWIAPARDLAMFTVTNAGGAAASEGTDQATLVLISRFDAAFGS